MERYLIQNGECCEHEQRIRKEKIVREELKKKQKERHDNICKLYKMLVEEICSYENDYKSHVFSKEYYDVLTQFISELSRLLT